LGPNLKSVILYGSAARHDNTKKYSDINILVLVETLTALVLRQLIPIVKKWEKKGNPAPKLMLEKTVKNASDVFPLEFLDIKAAHQILAGSDPFDSLTINPAHLKHQLEFELRGKLFQLRERYIELEAHPKHVAELMARTLSSLSVLFKGVLFLMNKPAPEHKKEVWAALAQHVMIDVQALNTIWKIRDGEQTWKSVDIDDIFSRLLLSVEAVIDFVDQFKS
jgi:hypothetical protein